jgi:hypothetical protein
LIGPLRVRQADFPEAERAERENTIMWSTIREAIKTWGQSVRFCLVILFLVAMYLIIWWFQR